MWAYQAMYMDWVCTHTLCPGASVAAIAWGQPLARPAELLALARDSSVEVHSLAGAADKLQV